jgi:ribonuclease P protein component
VQEQGRKVQSDHFLLLVKPAQVMRIGVTTSSRVGNAVTRNRVKRWVREWLRRHRDAWPQAEAVIIAKPSVAGVAHDVLDVDLDKLLRRGRGGR